MKAEDVTGTLKLALQASRLDQAAVMHRPRLLSDNGSSYVSTLIDPAFFSRSSFSIIPASPMP